MKSVLLRISSLGLLLAASHTTPLYAADTEGKAAVPTRADASNPDSAVYRASDVMNMPVKDDDGKEVGRIKDFVINGETSEVLYAVVAMNDSKEKDAVYVIPWTAFQPNYAQQGASLQYTVLTIPQTVWIRAPFYPMNQWRTTPYSQWGPRVNNYYSEHITVNNNTRSNTVTTNKPVIGDDKPKNATPDQKKPRRDGTNKDSANKDGGKQDGVQPVPKEDQPAKKEAADKPDATPNPNKSDNAKQADKPGPTPQVPSATKTGQRQNRAAKAANPKNANAAAPVDPFRVPPKTPVANPQ